MEELFPYIVTDERLLSLMSILFLCVTVNHKVIGWIHMILDTIVVGEEVVCCYIYYYMAWEIVEIFFINIGDR